MIGLLLLDDPHETSIIQPLEEYCRIALQRRLESDDQWLSPAPIPHTMLIVTIVVVILLRNLNHDWALRG